MSRIKRYAIDKLGEDEFQKLLDEEMERSNDQEAE